MLWDGAWGGCVASRRMGDGVVSMCRARTGKGLAENGPRKTQRQRGGGRGDGSDSRFCLMGAGFARVEVVEAVRASVRAAGAVLEL
jgi:hypothetical protein